MATLIVELEGKRRAAELNGRTSIGRLSTSDIVIDHPTVSRTHAWIEQASEKYFIRDTGSINGTLIGEAPVGDRYELKDGDCIRIGPASIMFCHTHALYHRDAAPAATAKDFSETGILFHCGCGARLWMPASNGGQEATCRKCGAAVICPDKHSRQNRDAAPGEALAPIQPAPTGTPRPPLVHPPAFVEKTICSICQWEVNPTDEAHKCPDCGLTFHAECWNANLGCSAYGCKQVNALATSQPGASFEPHEDVGHPPDLSAAEPAARIPLEYALLAGSVVASLAGALAFGVPALAIAVGCFLPILLKKPVGKSPIVLLAAVVSMLGFAGGVMFSWIWWL